MCRQESQVPSPVVLNEASTDAADPAVSVRVRGATGVSINTLDSAYSNFTVATVPTPP